MDKKVDEEELTEDQQEASDVLDEEEEVEDSRQEDTEKERVEKEDEDEEDSDEGKKDPEEQEESEGESSESTLDDLVNKNDNPDQQDAFRGHNNFSKEHEEENMRISPLGSPKIGDANRQATGSPARPAGGDYYIPQNQGSRGSSKKTVILIIILILIIAVPAIFLRDKIAGKLGFNQPTQLTEPTVSEISSPSPTPTPSPMISDRSQYEVTVLNGTTTSGAAKELSDKLQELGYQIDKIGNADSFDVPQTLVRVSPDNMALANTLVKDISDTYEASISADLASTATNSAEIVIGAR